MDEFFKIKQKRAIWVALFEQRNIIASKEYFENYIKEINTYIKKFDSINDQENLRTMAETEIKFATTLFVTKLKVLAKKMLQDNDYTNAAICYSILFDYDIQSVDFIGYLKVLNRLEQYDLFTYIVQYLESNNINPIFYKNIAALYDESENYEKAVKYFEKYMNSDVSTKSSYDYNLLGCYYNKLYSEVRPDKDILYKAIDCFKTAYKIEPCRTFIRNIIIMTEKAEETQLSAQYWAELISSNTMTNDDKYDYAAFCLKTSDFDGWHKYFDARFLKENNATPFPTMHKPKWDGEKDLSNSTLLIHSEQGFGDTFLMFGYFPRLQKLAKKVIFVVQNPAVSLLKNNTWGVEIISETEDLTKIDFDYYLPSMSIPTTLKYKREDLGVGGGYLKANENLIKDFKEKYFNTNKFKIGIAYFGNSAGNQTRDMDLKEFLPLDNLDNIELYCLHLGINDRTFDIFKHNKVNNIGKNFRNFEDTAAAMANLDLVLTTDNGLLNVAGALGKKTFALFNFNNEFRWFDLTGENVVWYDSVKPFVNDVQGNWQSSMNKAVEEIKKLI